MSYSENRKEYLNSYARNNDLLRDAVGGTWLGKGSYSHILKLPERASKNDKAKIVEKYQLEPFCLKLDLFPVGKLHRYAHHLNSSQILCYCYFRKMLDRYGHPKDPLIQLMSGLGIRISNRTFCSFEYDSFKEYKDGTEVDFHIQDGDTEVFFEIKYTEQDFGSTSKKVNKETYLKRFDTIYKPLLKNCICLDKDMDSATFYSSYQLHRNIIRISDKNKYTIFLYPAGNTILEKKYKTFQDSILEPYKNNVRALHWEDLITKENAPELYIKYFKQDL